MTMETSGALDHGDLALWTIGKVHVEMERVSEDCRAGRGAGDLGLARVSVQASLEQTMEREVP